MAQQLPKTTIDSIKEFIRTYPGFPNPGNIFQDIFSVLQKPDVFSQLHEVLLDRCKKIIPPMECIAAVESQGCLFGPMLALNLDVPFVPIKSVLHMNTFETVQGGFEIQKDGIKPGTRVILFDAVLGYGKSMAAACKLLQDLGAEVVECLVVVELLDMKGRNILPTSVYSLLQYPELVLCCIS